MKIITFIDMNNQEIQIQLSGGGDYRIYIKDGCTQETKACTLINKYQAKVLIGALEDLINDMEE